MNRFRWKVSRYTNSTFWIFSLLPQGKVQIFHLSSLVYQGDAKKQLPSLAKTEV